MNNVIFVYQKLKLNIKNVIHLNVLKELTFSKT